MGRSRFTFRHGLTAERSEDVVVEYLTSKGLKLMTQKSGELVWKNGSGILVSASFLSVYYEDYKTTVFAWIQTGMGLIVRSESEITGMGMAIPKMQITKVLEGLKAALENASPDDPSGPEAIEDRSDE